MKKCTATKSTRAKINFSPLTKSRNNEHIAKHFVTNEQNKLITCINRSTSKNKHIIEGYTNIFARKKSNPPLTHKSNHASKPKAPEQKEPRINLKDLITNNMTVKKQESKSLVELYKHKLKAAESNLGSIFEAIKSDRAVHDRMDELRYVFISFKTLVKGKRQRGLTSEEQLCNKMERLVEEINTEIQYRSNCIEGWANNLSQSLKLADELHCLYEDAVKGMSEDGKSLSKIDSRTLSVEMKELIRRNEIMEKQLKASNASLRLLREEKNKRIELQKCIIKGSSTHSYPKIYIKLFADKIVEYTRCMMNSFSTNIDTAHNDIQKINNSLVDKLSGKLRFVDTNKQSVVVFKESLTKILKTINIKKDEINKVLSSFKNLQNDILKLKANIAEEYSTGNSLLENLAAKDRETNGQESNLDARKLPSMAEACSNYTIAIEYQSNNQKNTNEVIAWCTSLE
eukprot:TRINITY_DN4667_c0_g1_i1.p1 TRINITY_DN4667_c0_g1~~TRINITY_DN4667_c0_g1_i1.p1  ORF type:complete len:457 (+),score=63.91 TRINITY_DN4667_c0_g1_i1:135-1505(+)